MFRAENPVLREKLFEIARKPRAFHRHPLVILPRALEPIPSEALFPSSGPRILELGAGWGEFCLKWLENHPEHNYVAFEIKGDRILNLLRRSDRLGIRNLRIIPVNFNWFLESILPPEAFDSVIINFPDPWPKKRHWKHRLIQEDFPARIRSLLRRQGTVRAATDYGPYARKILRTFRNSPLFEPLYPWPHYVRTRPPELPETRFERRHARAGLRSYYQGWKLSDARAA